jgi:hypothetical protein
MFSSFRHIAAHSGSKSEAVRITMSEVQLSPARAFCMLRMPAAAGRSFMPRYERGTPSAVRGLLTNALPVASRDIPHRQNKYVDLRMQTQLFRLGAIVVSPDLLTSIPRPATVQAIKQHATAEPEIKAFGSTSSPAW